MFDSSVVYGSEIPRSAAAGTEEFQNHHTSWKFTNGVTSRLDILK